MQVGYGMWTGQTIFTIQGQPTEEERVRGTYEPSEDPEEGDDEDFVWVPTETEYPPRGGGRTTNAGGGTNFEEWSPSPAGHQESYKAPNDDAKRIAHEYIKEVSEEFENTAAAWDSLVKKGNELVRLAGSVTAAAASLWEAREDKGLMNLRGIDGKEFEEILHPDLLAYLREVRRKGMDARYVGPRRRVKARLHPNAKKNVGQVFKQISKDVKKHRVLVVDNDLDGLQDVIDLPPSRLLTNRCQTGRSVRRRGSFMIREESTMGLRSFGTHQRFSPLILRWHNGSSGQRPGPRECQSSWQRRTSLELSGCCGCAAFGCSSFCGRSALAARESLW